MVNDINIYPCNNCICIPVCLNKNTHTLVKQCKLISYDLLHMSLAFKGNGERIHVHIFGLNRYIPIEIHLDVIYILDLNADLFSRIMGLDRYKYIGLIRKGCI